MAFYAGEDLVKLIYHIYPNRKNIDVALKQKECILQPNYHVFLRTVMLIAEQIYTKIEKISFPIILRMYYDNKHSLAYWQYLTYFLLQLPILALLIYKKDIYNAGV